MNINPDHSMQRERGGTDKSLSTRIHTSARAKKKKTRKQRNHTTPENPKTHTAQSTERRQSPMIKRGGWGREREREREKNHSKQSI